MATRSEVSSRYAEDHYEDALKEMLKKKQSF